MGSKVRGGVGSGSVVPFVAGPHVWQVREAEGGTRERRKAVKSSNGGFTVGEWEDAGPTPPGLYDAGWKLVAPAVDEAWGPPWTELALPLPPVELADVETLVRDLRGKVPNASIAVVDEGAQPPRLGAWPPWVEQLRALPLCFPGQAYEHQVEALEHLLAGEHVAIATGTASGKSLCYQLAALHLLLQEPGARVLYVSPAKALCDDQLASWHRLLTGQQRTARDAPFSAFTERLGPGELTVIRYDRGTKAEVNQLRDDARVILTNSTMLHWMLKGHARWARFLEGLRLVVVDEVHQARGVAGANLAWVVRRLRRLASFHRGGRQDLQVVLSSATIGNPAELGRQLIGDGREVVAVDRDASGHGTRQLVSWTAPTRPGGLGRVNVVPDLVRELLTGPRGPLQTIVFPRSRAEVNHTARFCAELLRRLGKEAHANGLRAFIAAYRDDRKRTILAALRSGECPCVFSTSALELGVDIGDLSVAIIVGVPHGRASFRQMAGRVGRRAVPGRESLVIFLPRDNPLDDWFADQGRFGPELALARPEDVVTDPANDVIAFDHIAAAANELPLELARDGAFFGAARTSTAMARLAQDGQIQLSDRDGCCYWVGRDDPHVRINVLAARGTDTVAIRVRASGEEIGEVDNWSALWMLFPGAIYEDGIRDTYVVESLHLGRVDSHGRGVHEEHDRGGDDTGERVAWVRPVSGAEARCHTVAETSGGVRVADPAAVESADLGSLRVSSGRLEVSTTLGDFFWKVEPAAGGRSIQEERRVRLPLPRHPTAVDEDGTRRPFDTIVRLCDGLWFTLPEALWQRVCSRATRLAKDGTDEDVAAAALASLHGAEHAICKLIGTVHGLCDDDIAGVSAIGHRDLPGPGIFLHEGVEGGVGVIDRLLGKDALASVVRAALEAVTGCRCEEGCPRCVMDRMCGSGNLQLDKEGSRLLLEDLLDLLESSPRQRTARRR